LIRINRVIVFGEPARLNDRPVVFARGAAEIVKLDQSGMADRAVIDRQQSSRGSQ